MWIECGIINYKLIIPFIYPAFFQIRLIIHRGEEKPLLKFFTNYLGYLFSGLIYLFIQWRMKKVVVSDEDINNIVVDTVVLELNDILLPNPEENNEIRASAFVAVKTHKNSLKKVKNQIDLERKKVQKKISKRKHLFLLVLAIIYLIPMVLDAFNPYTFKTSSSVSLFFL